MGRVYFNEGQEVVRADLNKLSAIIEQHLYDQVLKKMMQDIGEGVINDSLAVTRTDADTVQVAAGVGFVLETGSDAEPDYKPLVLAVAESLNITAAHATLGRIDRVVATWSLADGNTESRRYKATVASTPSLQNMVVDQEWEVTLSIVAGTASGSPAAPALPANSISLALLQVDAVTGIPVQGVTDDRTKLGIGDATRIDTSAFTALATQAAGTALSQVLEDVDSLARITRGAYDAVVGTEDYCTDATIAAAITRLSAGARILVISSEVLATTVTMSKANMEIILRQGVDISAGAAATGFTISAAGCIIRGGKISGFTTGIDVGAAGLRFMARDIWLSNTTDIADPNDLSTDVGCV